MLSTLRRGLLQTLTRGSGNGGSASLRRTYALVTSISDNPVSAAPKNAEKWLMNGTSNGINAHHHKVEILNERYVCMYYFRSLPNWEQQSCFVLGRMRALQI